MNQININDLEIYVLKAATDFVNTSLRSEEDKPYKISLSYLSHNRGCEVSIEGYDYKAKVVISPNQKESLKERLQFPEEHNINILFERTIRTSLDKIIRTETI